MLRVGVGGCWRENEIKALAELGKNTFSVWRPIDLSFPPISLSVRPIGLSVRSISLSMRPIGLSVCLISLSGENENKAKLSPATAGI